MDILLVEDSKVEAQIFAQTLERVMDEPVRIHHMVTLCDAIEQLQKAPENFDLVFLDLKLPDSVEWKQTYEAVAPYAYKVPVIVVSGEDDDHIAREVLNNGAEDYIVKGGKKRQVDLLKETIDFALLRHKKMRALADKAEEEARCVHWLMGGYAVE